MSIQFVCEILGTIAFAVSGAMLAIQHKMDIFGVLVMGTVTALGGGLMRDVILNITPPGMFSDPEYLFVALGSGTMTFLVIWWKHRHGALKHPEGRLQQALTFTEGNFQWILNLTDAIGLGMFTAIGVNVAIQAGYGQYDLFSVFLGMLTGVGGGMVRDILAGLTPAILVKKIYACASLAGAVCYQLLMKYAPGDYAMFVSALLVIAVRMAAYHWKLDLPKAIK